MNRRVTLGDVSKAAGVGIATVSRALAAEDHPDVSAQTRERIRKMAREMGYRPSAAARALRSGAVRTLSVIIPAETLGWYEPVILAAFRAAATEGAEIIVHPVVGSSGGVASTIASLVNVQTDGVLLFGRANEVSLLDAAVAQRLPVVSIDDASPEVIMPTIAPEGRNGVKALVDHLVDQGRSQIAVVTSWEGTYFAGQRLAGYRDGLRAAGLPYDERLVLHEADPDEAHPTSTPLDALLDSGVTPDAIICLADLLAAPVLRTLYRRGLRVPDDIAVGGYDDERAARLFTPALTSVRQPYAQLGERAVELLLQLVDGAELPSTREEFATELIIRGSTVTGR